MPQQPTVLPTRHHLYLLAVVVLLEAARRFGSAPMLDRLVDGLAHVAYRASHTKRQRMEASLTRVFGPLAPHERERIVRGAFRTFWDDALSLVPWRVAAGPAPTIEGLAHLEAALAAGRGVILWESGFFGLRHVAKQALRHRGFAVHQVHEKTHRAGFAGDPHSHWLRDRVVLPYFTAREREFTADLILFTRDGSLAFTRTLQAALQRNEIVCITADVAMGDRLMTLSLLGEPKRFATGMVNLARHCGAPLLPLFCVRTRDGGIRVVIEPAITQSETGTRDERIAAPLRAYAALLEEWIRRHPDQYRNWHYPWWTLG